MSVWTKLRQIFLNELPQLSLLLIEAVILVFEVKVDEVTLTFQMSWGTAFPIEIEYKF